MKIHAENHVQRDVKKIENPDIAFVLAHKVVSKHSRTAVRATRVYTAVLVQRPHERPARVVSHPCSFMAPT